MPVARQNPTPPIDTPASTIASARAGDTAALGALYERHARELLAIAFRLLQSVPDAEDVVHDVFVGLPEALRRYEERGAFASWLRKVTARVALARLRQRSERDPVSLEDVGEPAQRQRDVEGMLSLEQAMKALSPSLRAVVVLREIEGFSHAEVAGLLDISVGASEVRLHRALQALRAALTKGERE